MNDDHNYWLELIAWTPAVLLAVAFGECLVQLVTR